MNDGVWEELEQYIYTGFLIAPAYLVSHNFVFKSLNHHEIRMIEFMRPVGAQPIEARSLFRAHFIAHSVFMIDGSNVMFERPRNISKLIRIISRLPPEIQDKIIENLGSLNSRAHRLFPLAEVYSFEPRSRYRWLQLSGSPIHSPLSTGIPGTDELGMNYAQLTWTAMNRVQDQKERIERDWSNTKFIGSCMSKGIRQIDEKDRSRAEKERTDLEDRKIQVLYEYINRVDPKSTREANLVQLPDGRQAVVEKRFMADTAEELADQLSSALSGEKDHHDMVIEKQMEKLQARSKYIEEQQRRVYSSPKIELPESKSIGHGSSMIIGGQEEADSHMARIRELQFKQMESVRRISLDINSEEEPQS